MTLFPERGGSRFTWFASPSVPRESTRLMSTGGAKLWV
jgi:hypothetical protein